MHAALGVAHEAAVAAFLEQRALARVALGREEADGRALAQAGVDARVGGDGGERVVGGVGGGRERLVREAADAALADPHIRAVRVREDDGAEHVRLPDTHTHERAGERRRRGAAPERGARVVDAGRRGRGRTARAEEGQRGLLAGRHEARFARAARAGTRPTRTLAA